MIPQGGYANRMPYPVEEYQENNAHINEALTLLGGPDNMMMSNLIEQNMNNFNSNLAAAMSFELLVIVFIIIGIAFKFVGNIFVNKK